MFMKISSRDTPLYTEGECGIWALHLADIAIKDGKNVSIVFASDVNSLHVGSLYYHVAVDIGGSLYDSSGMIPYGEMNSYAPSDEDEPFYVFKIQYGAGDKSQDELIREVIRKQHTENPFSDWDDEDDLPNVTTFYKYKVNDA